MANARQEFQPGDRVRVRQDIIPACAVVPHIPEELGLVGTVRGYSLRLIWPGHMVLVEFDHPYPVALILGHWIALAVQYYEPCELESET